LRTFFVINSFLGQYLRQRQSISAAYCMSS
jgi:hypothetical protein